jgi:hypothetical protein
MAAFAGPLRRVRSKLTAFGGWLFSQDFLKTTQG